MNHTIQIMPNLNQLNNAAAAAAAKSLQSCPTLCDPIDGSPSGSLIPGILQARTLEWVEQNLIRAKDAVAVPRASGLAWLLAGPH